MENIDGQKEKLSSWFIPMIGGLFFFYAFIQCNMMSPLQHALQTSFQAQAGKIGLLGAFYFYGNVLFLLPAGLLLDRWPIRRSFFLGMVLAIGGNIIFAFASHIYMAAFGRFLSGMMMSFGLIACLKLASLWLDASKMAMASAWIVTIGMVGGMISQTPISYLNTLFSWRSTVLIVAAFGLVISLILAFFVKEPYRIENKSGNKEVSIFRSLRQVMANRINWQTSFFICLLNIPVAILGALFGVTYLMNGYQLTPILASSIVSMLFLGMIVGAPFFGWVAGWLQSKRLPMIVGATFCLLFTLVLLAKLPLNTSLLYGLFFLIGFTSAAQVLGYPIVAENNPQVIGGTAMSLASMIVMGVGYGLGLPFVGKLIDVFTDHIKDLHTAYRMAFLILPLSILISMILTIGLKKSVKLRKIPVE